MSDRKLRQILEISLELIKAGEEEGWGLMM